MGKTLPKRDRHGIYAVVETETLMLLKLAITAAFEERARKSAVLKHIRIVIEVLKRLIRAMLELDIITEKIYWERELELQAMSKMAFRWLEWITKNQNSV